MEREESICMCEKTKELEKKWSHKLETHWLSVDFEDMVEPSDKTSGKYSGNVGFKIKKLVYIQDSGSGIICINIIELRK